MNNYEFYEEVLDNINLFFGILICSFILHYLLFRKQVKSFFDPYFLAVISSVFCFTDVLFLFIVNKISTYLLSSYVLTQVGFVLGFYTFKIKKKILSGDDKKNYIEKVNSRNVIAFYFFSFIYLFNQCLIYKLKGIPLFMESYLETFASGGGSGVLGRVSDVTSIIGLYSFFLVIKIDKFRISEIPKYIILVLYFVTFFLSGSKSVFFLVFTVFWCHIAFLKTKKGNYEMYSMLLKNNMKFILGFTLVFLLIIIYTQTSIHTENIEDRANPLFGLLLRFVHSGDIYWYAYPNNVYLQIPNNQWFAALFNDTLGFLRIMDWKDLPQVIGITFKNIHHPSDIPSGPNGRHNVFGLIYFGFFGSILFSYCIGLILSFIRNKLSLFLSNNFFGGAVFTYLITKSAALDSDPMLTITYFNNVIFIFSILYFLYLILIEFLKINPNNYEKKI
ncbi:O-antigen polymerase [Flavobacterium gawalongense]|uniref:Oligosaccharide repeat unit polymerase n=1 Tax=Flavobacterium gawalongense TaxID=2594432 RepID=A0A553BYT4_9FLAO|nr:O-antigen polymerase [Flavobacterium gawalongense]TRX13394.1 oligosaccharide repeat unit polymerase [Flavobacterium gawalongense]TRX15676.1 oligosaccharide repeat unit polymerase [Flavobacterium gawalongense]TRX31514.1 oligosaccharide repeat unit polymerase [Flavobacterium gawalongense]